VCDKCGFIAYKMLYCMCKNVGALGVYYMCRLPLGM